MCIIFFAALCGFTANRAAGHSASFGTADSGPVSSAWPVFHHDNQRTGTSSYRGPSVKYVRWSFKTGAPVTASPVIDTDGSVYVGSWDQYMYAFTNAGLLKWRYKTGNIIRSSAAIAEPGIILFGSNDGNLYALTREGQLLWTFEAGGAIVSSPAVDNGTVFFGSADSTVYAVNLDGTVKWSFAVPRNAVDSSPSIGYDGRVYIGEWDFFVYGLDSQSGILQWVWPFKTWFFGDDTLESDICFYGGVFSSPAVAPDGSLYIANDTINRGTDCAPEDDYYFFRVTPCVAGGAMCITGANFNVSFGDADVYSTAAVRDDASTFIGYDTNVLHVLPDGVLSWSYQTEGKVDSSPAVDVNSNVYIGSSDNHLYALTGNGDLRWRFETFGSITSSPSIGPGGTVFVGSADGRIYAVGGAMCPLQLMYAGQDEKLHMFRMIRDRILSETRLGRQLIRMYYEQAGEIIRLFNTHPHLQHQAISIAEYVISHCDAIVASVPLHVDRAMMQQLLLFLDELQDYADGQLGRGLAVLRREMEQKNMFNSIGVFREDQ